VVFALSLVGICTIFIYMINLSRFKYRPNALVGFEFTVSGSRVQGSGFRVQGPGFKVQGSGFRVEGVGRGFRAVTRGHLHHLHLHDQPFPFQEPL